MRAAKPTLSGASLGSIIWVWTAFGAAVCLAAGTLAWFGTGPDAVTLAVRMTARLAFLAFWPAYVGGALVALFGSAFEPIKGRGRELGLAFAAVLLVHLSLVAWLSLSGHPPSSRTFVIFGIGVLWAGALSLFSIERLGKLPGPVGWWTLRNVGMNYLLFDFALDFFRPAHSGSFVGLALYVPFQALIVAAIGLRLLAVAKGLAGRQKATIAKGA
jgi:hypothetical protein